jgi:hypothetical protein
MFDIHVNWEGPFTLEQAMELDGYGLYQYYGDHPVYGAGVLLYIGKVEKQTFAKRLKVHNWHLWNAAPTTIFVGRICTKSPIDHSEVVRQIDLAEKIEIYAHGPAFNSKSLNSIPRNEDDVRVLNWGQRKSLLPEVSISRWQNPEKTGKGDDVGHALPKSLHRYSRSG